MARCALLGGLWTLSLWAVLLLQRVELVVVAVLVLVLWGSAMAAGIVAMVLVDLSRPSALAVGMRGGQVARWGRAGGPKRLGAPHDVKRCPSRVAIALVVGRGVVRFRVA